MGYIFLNIKSAEQYRCEDDFWKKALSVAMEEEWEPLGTDFDFSFELDDYCDEPDDIIQNLYMFVQVNNRAVEWDRNYIEKENQVVAEDDAWLMKTALEQSSIEFDPEFLRFLSSGAFRICR
ncbi:MAG: hypothetical protein GY754_45080 [bacterium]|nr:hypothetical protein [bacterium]